MAIWSKFFCPNLELVFYTLYANLGVHRHFGKKKRKTNMKREGKRILTVALFFNDGSSSINYLKMTEYNETRLRINLFQS